METPSYVLVATCTRSSALTASGKTETCEHVVSEAQRFACPHCGVALRYMNAIGYCAGCRRDVLVTPMRMAPVAA